MSKSRIIAIFSGQNVLPEHIHDDILSIKKPKDLTFVRKDAIVALWMVTMSFGIALILWYGIALSNSPWLSILSLATAFYISFVTVVRIIRKEIQDGLEKNSS